MNYVKERLEFISDCVLLAIFIVLSIMLLITQSRVVELEKDLCVIRAVLITKQIMPCELAKEKE